MARQHIPAAGGAPTIAIWGLAYKKDTASTKNSKSLEVIRELAGTARLRAYDPQVKQLDGGVTLCGRDEALDGADGLLIMTEWDEFAKVDPVVFKRMRRPVVIDCVGILRDARGVRHYTMGRAPRRRAVFLDRDGVLVRTHYQNGRAMAPLSLDAFALDDGAREAVARLQAEGFLCVVVTNQPEVARKLLAPAVLEKMHEILREKTGVDDILVCPHERSQGCGCCKPRPGMITQAADKRGIELGGSYMVGDRWVDIDAGRAAGVYSILIEQPYSECAVADGKVRDLKGAVDHILDRERVSV
jgi:D-glycero-D-manno-heptose 1,7-bisphosphate phosphatase